jgi:hypothetical protein
LSYLSQLLTIAKVVVRTNSKEYLLIFYTDYVANFQVDIKGRMLQESKVRNISNVDAIEFVELFYNSGTSEYLVFYSLTRISGQELACWAQYGRIPGMDEPRRG